MKESLEGQEIIPEGTTWKKALDTVKRIYSAVKEVYQTTSQIVFVGKFKFKLFRKKIQVIVL